MYIPLSNFKTKSLSVFALYSTTTSFFALLLIFFGQSKNIFYFWPFTLLPGNTNFHKRKCLDNVLKRPFCASSNINTCSVAAAAICLFIFSSYFPLSWQLCHRTAPKWWSIRRKNDSQQQQQLHWGEIRKTKQNL